MITLVCLSLQGNADEGAVCKRQRLHRRKKKMDRTDLAIKCTVSCILSQDSGLRPAD